MDSYTVIIERSSTGYGAYSPDVLGCVATARTVEETLTLMREALVFHLEDLADCGQALPSAQGIEFHLRSSVDRPEPMDFITTIPIKEVAPGVVA